MGKAWIILGSIEFFKSETFQMIEKSKWQLLQNMIYQKTPKNIFANKNIEHVIESDSWWLFFAFQNASWRNKNKQNGNVVAFSFSMNLEKKNFLRLNASSQLINDNEKVGHGHYPESLTTSSWRQKIRKKSVQFRA